MRSIIQKAPVAVRFGILAFELLLIASSTIAGDRCQGAREFAYKKFGDIYKNPMPETQCCKNLKPLAFYGLVDGKCESLTGPSLHCMPCGDGKCDYSEYENICNCPEDCKLPRKKCASEGELIATGKASTVPSTVWYPKECCRGLKERFYSSELSRCSKQD